ncbi:hypothetical protein JZ751_017560 [Albula glossodonta]|uniref:Uncharacterized protein n=1 Tax=Albula glossodonta TaxID=121402 RepID=A0A8T2PK70_9TELE|nr:hypothetical protein JZ751_017560 [Albula glossodonta]
MEWYLLALVLCSCLPSSTQADCSTRCLTCAHQSPNLDTFINSLKYGISVRKLLQRDIPEIEEDSQQEDGASEDELAVFNDDTPLDEVKRYGGFLRKFGPKRTDRSAEENSEEELQKRYGGFMRRIRPKLKWDNQKRYGGFLRRHFKISVRSDEEPSSYDVIDL